MTEVGGRLSPVVRTVVEAMTALPDILAGLFIYTTLIIALGFSRTGFCAAMALTVMMLPIIARSAEVLLRVVPGGLREAGLALGASHWQTVWRVVLPTARPGLATALILGVARAVGETAPVLITSGASTFLNVNPIKDPMNSLPLFIFTAVRSGEPPYIARGFGAASVLLALVLVLFVITRLLARQQGPAADEPPRTRISQRRSAMRHAVRLVSWRAVRACLPTCGGPTAGPGAANSHALIQGSGSSWSANAVNQWIADVQSNGLQVVFTGSRLGHRAARTSPTRPPTSRSATSATRARPTVTGDDDTPQGRAYAYLPIVAGGTSFPYQVKVGGQLVRNLRLSGETLAKIFTNQITNWNDPADHRRQQRPQAAVAADHPGRPLRGLRLDGAVHPLPRHAVPEHLAAVPRQAGFTEYFPRKGQAIAQNGSDGVMNFVSHRRPPTARSATTSTPTRSARTTRSPRSRTRPATSRCPRSTTSRWR